MWCSPCEPTLWIRFWFPNAIPVECNGLGLPVLLVSRTLAGHDGFHHRVMAQGLAGLWYVISRFLQPLRGITAVSVPPMLVARPSGTLVIAAILLWYCELL